MFNFTMIGIAALPHWRDRYIHANTQTHKHKHYKHIHNSKYTSTATVIISAIERSDIWCGQECF